MLRQKAEEGEEDDEWEEAEEEDDDEDADDDAQEMDADAATAHARAAAAALASDSGSRAVNIEEAMKELNMDAYDEEEDGEENLMGRVLGGNSKPGMAFYNTNDEDPYITLKDDSDSEVDDFTIRETDLLLLSARNEDDVSNIEVWVYEEATANSEANLYVHHDIMLPAFPLSLAWMNYDPSQKQEKSNMVAVGTFDPAIEIWDLDVIDNVEPVVVLGGEDAEAAAQEAPGGDGKKKKKKKKKKAPKLKEGSHTDAVLGLSWNREYRNVLASASADHTVKVWDLAAAKCEHTLTHHSGKVQSVAWNPAESPVLLTGSFDKTACLVDVRSAGSDPLRWQLSADVETLCWVPHDPTNFIVASEDGIVACFDARRGAGSEPLYQLSAHDKPTCALSFCPSAPGLLATASTDKKVKFWDVSGGQAASLGVQEMKPVGAVFSAAFCNDAPHLFAAGGAKGTLQVLDVRILPGVVAKFPALMQSGGPVAAPVTGGQDTKEE